MIERIEAMFQSSVFLTTSSHMTLFSLARYVYLQERRASERECGYFLGQSPDRTSGVLKNKTDQILSEKMQLLEYSQVPPLQPQDQMSR